VEKVSSFDIRVARDYNKTRQDFTKSFLESVESQVKLISALDVGCGVGYFSKFLSEMGFRVVALDGREENVIEGGRRYPDITFIAQDVEHPSLPGIGVFDFVLCVGLLYHLENPFRAIRNLYSMTGQVLLVETMCVPDSRPMMDLLDESHSENQGLNYVAFYPSESCIVKMLYRTGFPFVYCFKRLPADERFSSSLSRKRLRTFLVASKIELKGPNLVLAKERIRPCPGISDPWSTTWSRIRDRLSMRATRLKLAIRPPKRAPGSLPSGGMEER
jgi:SAM-dependent methyltransferase